MEQYKLMKNILGTWMITIMAVACLLLGLKACTDGGEPKRTKQEQWIPTVEDQLYLDSLWDIVNTTQREVDTIKEHVDTIIMKLDEMMNTDDMYNIEMDCGDTIQVRATMYHPVKGQCDSNPDRTADQTKIPNVDSCSHLNWIAVSQDLLWFNGGPIRYGDTVYVIAGHKTGKYIVHDAMNKRARMKIDFLESIGTQVYRYKKAELIINS